MGIKNNLSTSQRVSQQETSSMRKPPYPPPSPQRKRTQKGRHPRFNQLGARLPAPCRTRCQVGFGSKTALTMRFPYADTPRQGTHRTWPAFQRCKLLLYQQGQNGNNSCSAPPLPFNTPLPFHTPTSHFVPLKAVHKQPPPTEHNNNPQQPTTTHNLQESTTCTPKKNKQNSTTGWETYQSCAHSNWSETISRGGCRCWTTRPSRSGRWRRRRLDPDHMSQTWASCHRSIQTRPGR